MVPKGGSLLDSLAATSVDGRRGRGEVIVEDGFINTVDVSTAATLEFVLAERF